jgi:hypothetical protein
MLVQFTKFACLFASPHRIAVISAVFAFSIPVATIQAQSVEILRVDIENGHVDGNGNGWEEDAFRFLQDALAKANELLDQTPPPIGVDIWVAAGEYRPDQTKDNDFCDDEAEPDPGICCPPFGDCNQDATFEIPSNVRVFGGFVGDENSLDERTLGPEATILTGTLGKGSFDFSFYVVTFDDTDSTARLDTVTITGETRIRFRNSDAVLTNSIVRDTSGVVMETTSPGGQIVSTPRIVNCQFINNGSKPTGAIVINRGVRATLVNSLMHDNWAGILLGEGDGGAIAVIGDNPVGFPPITPAEAVIINCTIVRNSATGDGGGIYLKGQGTTRIENSILWENTDTNGQNDDESAQIFDDSVPGAEVFYTCIMNLSSFSGNNNTDDDPDFVDANGGDFRLSEHSPSIDIGNADLLPCDWFPDMHDGSINGWPDEVNCSNFDDQKIPIDLDGNRPGRVG